MTGGSPISGNFHMILWSFWAEMAHIFRVFQGDFQKPVLSKGDPRSPGCRTWRSLEEKVASFARNGGEGYGSARAFRPCCGGYLCRFKGFQWVEAAKTLRVAEAVAGLDFFCAMRTLCAKQHIDVIYIAYIYICMRKSLRYLLLDLEDLPMLNRSELNWRSEKEA